MELFKESIYEYRQRINAQKYIDRLKLSVLSPTVKPVLEIDAIDYSFEVLKKLTHNFVSPVVVRGLFSQTEAVKKWSSPEFFSKNYGQQKFLVYLKGLLQDQIQDVAYGYG